MDLTGQKFGRLLVLGMLRKNGREYCKCECSCEAHSIVEVWVHSLLNGDTKSCGCYNLEKLHERRKDLSGQVFGRWKVLEYVGNNKYKCECSCDNHTISNIDANSLRQCTSTSCGCIKHEKKIQRLNSFIGQKFGEYTIESILDYDNHKPYANAVCNNGHSRKIRVDNFYKLKECAICKRDRKEIENSNIVRKQRKSKLVNIGDRFGQLIVKDIFMNNNITMCTCKCSCGEEVSLPKYDLYHRKTCGKCRKIDLVGQTFGRWHVISFDTSVNKWRCICSCENHTIGYISTGDLRSGHSTSCGCYAREYLAELHRKDLTGQRFGKLRVIELATDNRVGGRVHWKCRCDCGNITVVSSSNLLKHHVQSCGRCMSGKSMKETEIREYVRQLVPNIKMEHAKILDGKEIDIYLPEYKLGIEYNGSVYHASLGGIFKDKPKDYHQQKFLLAKEKGIHLINIFDVDYEQNKDKILAYIKDILIYGKQIYATDCEIMQIDNNIAWEFIDKYYLHNANRKLMKINYGLYYNDELYAVMSFGKLRERTQKDGCFVFYQYCVKNGYIFIGGVEKLFKLFIQEYNPTYIRSHSDNDYFSGQIYLKLGFVEKKQETPSYYWLYKNAQLGREWYSLKYLKIKYPTLYRNSIASGINSKVDYILLKLGAKKIFRSGCTLWEWYFNG